MGKDVEPASLWDPLELGCGESVDFLWKNPRIDFWLLDEAVVELDLLKEGTGHGSCLTVGPAMTVTKVDGQVYMSRGKWKLALLLNIGVGREDARTRSRRGGPSLGAR